MSRWWVSWYTRTAPDEGDPPLTWTSGYTSAEPPEHILIAVVDAEGTEAVIGKLAPLYPDMRLRFCDRVADDWMPPADRFPL